MPPNAEAAAVTDAVRARLIRLRDAVSRSVAARLLAVNLDAARDDLTAAFAEWVTSSALLIELAQRAAAQEGDRYVAAYLLAAGITPSATGAEVERHVGTVLGRPVNTALDSARTAMLAQLAKRNGRQAAVASGVDGAVRVSRSAVMSSARGATAERMAAEPRITGWRRVTATSPCGACLALAGRVYETNAAFDAHDRCSCSGEPVVSHLPETVTRPTGQQRWDAMTPADKQRFLAGRGGADKAALVDRVGVDALVSHVNGQLVETPLAAL